MSKTTVVVTETMEQVHKHCEKYLALHREITDESAILTLAIRERWGEADPADVLMQAEQNSLAAARMRLIADPQKNRWVTTSVQGDMFNDVPLQIPSVLIIDGKPTPYYEASILDGLEWRRARQDSKGMEKDRFFEAGRTREKEETEAAAEAEKVESLVRKALEAGRDPRTVLYARTQA